MVKAKRDVYYETIRQHRQPWIYYVRAGERKAVKIGVARNPAQRISQIQIGTPDQLILIGLEKGDREAEQALHQRFASLKIRGEWYRLEGELEQHISTLNAEQDTEADRCDLQLRRIKDGRIVVVERLSQVIMAVEDDLESARKLAERWSRIGLTRARAEAISNRDFDRMMDSIANGLSRKAIMADLYSSTRKRRNKAEPSVDKD